MTPEPVHGHHQTARTPVRSRQSCERRQIDGQPSQLRSSSRCPYVKAQKTDDRDLEAIAEADTPTQMIQSCITAGFWADGCRSTGHPRIMVSSGKTDLGLRSSAKAVVRPKSLPSSRSYVTAGILTVRNGNESRCVFAGLGTACSVPKVLDPPFDMPNFVGH
jgi:hypothetical protein